MSVAVHDLVYLRDGKGKGVGIDVSSLNRDPHQPFVFEYDGRRWRPTGRLLVSDRGRVAEVFVPLDPALENCE